MCLLYIFCSPSLHAQGFSFRTNPQETGFGEVSTWPLNKKTAAKLKSSQLNFEEWASFFSVRTNSDARPMLGSYRIHGEQIVFSPRFHPDPKIEYVITFSYPALKEVVGASIDRNDTIQAFKRFALDSKPTQLLQFSPDSDTLPQNLLRAYLHFSAPMGFQNPYDFIALINEAGDTIETPFVELPEGLWNEFRTRMTLLFHPGRIKQGVEPNRSMGTPMRSSEKFRLVVSKKWKDAAGNPLDQDFKKQFITSAPVREKMQKNDFQLQTSRETQLSVLVDVVRLLDQEMAQKHIRIEDDNGNRLTSNISFVTGRRFIVRSNEFESAKKYRLYINPRLEDVCGNTFLNAFDYSEGSRIKEGNEIVLEFEF